MKQLVLVEQGGPALTAYTGPSISVDADNTLIVERNKGFSKVLELALTSSDAICATYFGI
jgi:hypothetical protein